MAPWDAPKRDDVPETISDKAYERIRNGFVKALPMIDGPWVDPLTAARVRALQAISRARGDN
jgi:hypothetical protein